MELRHYPRESVHTQQKILCLSDQSHHFEKDIVISKNISASGFCFRSSRPFKNGKVMFVYVNDEVIQDLKGNLARIIKVGNYFMARVVWCRPAGGDPPGAGAAQAPGIDPFHEVGCSFVPIAEGNGESVSLFTRFVNYFTVDAL